MGSICASSIPKSNPYSEPVIVWAAVHIASQNAPFPKCPKSAHLAESFSCEEWADWASPVKSGLPLQIEHISSLGQVCSNLRGGQNVVHDYRGGEF